MAIRVRNRPKPKPKKGLAYEKHHQCSGVCIVPDDCRPAWRTCLGIKCGKSFWSLGPGLRKCKRCREKHDAAHLSKNELYPVTSTYRE